MELIDQQVINDNKEIYAKIQGELFKAEFEILIVTAWFTDDDLFDILLSKLAEGVHVEVIVADNQENERLDFGLLTSKGAAVFKIKNSGYGGMNQKFCVIDKRIALHGSYNWTHNAKKNNQESIISTNHQETITSLIGNFNELKNRIANQPVVLAAPRPDKPKGIPVETPLKAGADFEHVLDSMIAAEVGNFDRKLLREQGFDRASTNNGDHQVLPNALDTVYSVFINDIDVIDDKKKRLITKIEEHRVKNIDHLTKTSELQLDFLQRESDLNQSSLDTKRTSIEADIEVTQKDIEELKNTKIPFIENKNAELDQQIKLAEREFLRPRFKWFDFIPTAVFNLALLVYLFLFYSSAAYILLFSVADAKLAQANGIPVASAQIFNPDALTKAFHKSGTAPLFILLFVFIPLAFAVIDRFVTALWVQFASIIFGVILLDGAVAYKVTQAVYEVNYTSGNVNVPWQFDMAFSDPNFYLVFVFGAFGLLLFKLAFKKLMHIFEDRNPDILTQRNLLHIKQLRDEMTAHTGKIMLLKEEAATLEKNIIQLKADIKQLAIEVGALPVTLNQALQKCRAQLITDSKTIDEIAAIYTQHIQSDNLPISVDALKDRINIFLEGWNDFLCQEYAVVKAALKTSQAAEAATEWQREKLSGNKIDKRVKIS
ncbi:MAG: phospholipase D-like domain-containing protein [Bacteroidota bacterium]